MKPLIYLCRRIIMRKSGECMIKVCTINDDFLSCNSIKSNIPFNISEKLIELYLDWDCKKESLYYFLKNQCDLYPFITPYVENYFEDIIELFKIKNIQTPTNIYYDFLDNPSSKIPCENIVDIAEWNNSYYSYIFKEDDDLFLK